MESRTEFHTEYSTEGLVFRYTVPYIAFFIEYLTAHPTSQSWHTPCKLSTIPLLDSSDIYMSSLVRRKFGPPHT